MTGPWNSPARVAQRTAETLADIAYLAGTARFHTGDSREDIQSFIAWAAEFESKWSEEKDDSGDYMLAIETFTLAKLEGNPT